MTTTRTTTLRGRPSGREASGAEPGSILAVDLGLAPAAITPPQRSVRANIDANVARYRQYSRNIFPIFHFHCGFRNPCKTEGVVTPRHEPTWEQDMSTLDFQDREPDLNPARRQSNQPFAGNTAFYDRLQGRNKSAMARYGWVALPVAAVAIIGVVAMTS